MLISLCSMLFDYNACYLVDAEEDSETSYVSRRLSRSATLDGGCVIVDNGYTASDATFSLNIKNIDNSTRLGIIAMVKRHSLLTLSVKENIFSGAVETMADKESLKIRFLVKAQLNA